MANIARALLESALAARKLDRTLTTKLPPLERRDGSVVVAMDAAPFDRCLHGGLPRGQLSEIAGPSSSGRTTLLLQLAAAATARGEIVALVDTLDRLDVASAAMAGVDLTRLLWIRGHEISRPQGPGPRPQPDGRPQASDLGPQPESSWGLRPGPWGLLDRALKALNLVLQAGGFGVVAIDLADVPSSTLKQIPFTTWMRVQRVIEGSDTVCVLLTPEPLARSAGGLTMALAGRSAWAGESRQSHRLAGLDVHVRVVSPRRRFDGDTRVRAVASDEHGGSQDPPLQRSPGTSPQRATLTAGR
jgi:recombination protein RecA